MARFSWLVMDHAMAAMSKLFKVYQRILSIFEKITPKTGECVLKKQNQRLGSNPQQARFSKGKGFMKNSASWTLPSSFEQKDRTRIVKL